MSLETPCSLCGPPPGALGYVPLCFVMPCAMYLRVNRGSMSALQVSLRFRCGQLGSAVCEVPCRAS